MYVDLIVPTDGQVVAPRTKSSTDEDRLFDLVMNLSDFAYERGMHLVSYKLEDVLDALVDPDGQSATTGQFADVEPEALTDILRARKKALQD